MKATPFVVPPAKACRRCGHQLVLSLLAIPLCPACVRKDHGEVDALVASGLQLAKKQHIALLKLAEK